ncbi:prepilin-type N-terminal cleavage/methylation domain-containing protein [Bacillus sp. 37MA]
MKHKEDGFTLLEMMLVFMSI